MVLKLAQGLLKQILFALTRYSYISSRYAIWWFIGYLKLFKRYERSARIERIVWRSKKDIFESVRPHHFIGVHLRFDHPRCVLADDTILMCVTVNEAVFLRMPNSIWEYAADKVPFSWITLYEKAIETITLPIWSLNRLADEMGEVKTPSLIVSTQGRCGSTLLCKLMHLSDHRLLVLSEPDPLQCLQEMLVHRKQLSTEFLHIVCSALRLSFKPVQGAEAIVIKVRMTAMRIIRYVALAEPRIKHIYMQRHDLLKTVQSWERAFTPAWQAKLFMLLGKFRLIKLLLGSVFDVEKEQVGIFKIAANTLNMSNQFECMVSIWADNASAYNQFKNEFDFHTIFYEDLLAKPEEVVRTAFQILNIEPENLQMGVELGFSTDSQKNTPLSMEAISDKKPSAYTPDVKKRIDKFLDILGLPHLD